MSDRPVDVLSEPLTDIEALRAKAWALCEAYAEKSAADGLAARGLLHWKDQMAADDRFLAALQALRTACDGRPR